MVPVYRLVLDELEEPRLGARKLGERSYEFVGGRGKMFRKSGKDERLHVGVFIVDKSVDGGVVLVFGWSCGSHD